MAHSSSRSTLVLMMVGALLLASCSTAPSSPPTAQTIGQPTGRLNVMVSWGAGHIEPLLASTGNFISVGSAIWGTLTTYDRVTNNRLSPLIAERWEISPDGMTQTFYIRKGVKFHDGSDLTGADVKFSIERNMGQEAINRDAAVWREAISKVELKDDYTVVFRMKAPRYELIGSEGESTGAVVPKKYIEEKGVEQWQKTLVGSGPWKVVKYELGNFVELEANENYWGKVPEFKNITIISVPNMASKVAMLKTGELDVGEVDPDSLKDLRAASVRVFKGDAESGYYVVPFYDKDHPEKYAFGDVRVRKALQLSINQKELGDTIFGGDGRPFYNYRFSTKADFYDPNTMKPDPYDPEGAKKLLAEAGYAKGFDIRFFDVGEGGLRSIVNLATVGYLRQIGVNAQIVPMTFTAFYSKMMPRQDPEIWPSLWGYGSGGGGTPDFSGFVSGFHSVKGIGKNHNNKRLDEVIDLVPKTVDPVKRKQLQMEAAQLVTNEFIVLEIVAVPSYWAATYKVGDWRGSQMGIFSGAALNTLTHAK